MKKLLLVSVLLLGFSVMAVAQDTPVAEIFGGYSYVRPDTQDGDVNLNMNGWNLSVAFPGNKYLGFLTDFGGLYGKEGSTEDDEIKYRAYTVMFGPKVAIRLGKVTPFAQALFGYARLTGKSFQEVEVQRENNFAYTIGGGIDVNLNNLVAIRPIQVEYLSVKSQGDMTDNFRYSAGVVLKLGKR
jgi:opacity protein-like surface antigen